MESSRIVFKKILNDPELRRHAFSVINDDCLKDKVQKYIYRLIKKIDTGQIITTEMLIAEIERLQLKESSLTALSEEVGSIAASREILRSEFDH